jgi:hypothetical protein
MSWGASVYQGRAFVLFSVEGDHWVAPPDNWLRRTPFKPPTKEQGMSEQATTRNGFVGFLTTVPGILTAIAALATALGSVYLGVHGDPLGSRPDQKPATLTVNLTMSPGGPPPAAAATTSQESLRLDNVDSGQLATDDPVQQLIDGCTQGVESSCVEILDELTQSCSTGSGLSCDVLYEISPPGSNYEEYGATCGARVGDEFADTCSEL